MRIPVGGGSALFLSQTTSKRLLQKRALFRKDGFEGKNDPRALVLVKVDFECGEFFVELDVRDLCPVDEVQVLAGFDEWENLYTKGGQDDVGMPGAVRGNLGEEGREDEEGESHPPREGRVPHEPGEADQE